MGQARLLHAKQVIVRHILAHLPVHQAHLQPGLVEVLQQVVPGLHHIIIVLGRILLPHLEAGSPVVHAHPLLGAMVERRAAHHGVATVIQDHVVHLHGVIAAALVALQAGLAVQVLEGRLAEALVVADLAQEVSEVEALAVADLVVVSVAVVDTAEDINPSVCFSVPQDKTVSQV